MTTLLQATFDGIALGSLYALIVLGFVVIYRATGIINFAQGGALLLGGYITYNVSTSWVGTISSASSFGSGVRRIQRAVATSHVAASLSRGHRNLCWSAGVGDAVLQRNHPSCRSGGRRRYWSAGSVRNRSDRGARRRQGPV